mmetsp:Transcript_5254/g.10877  ORF Transcript_5254/g.10877 Transcript_5254/m.10877 type:complete len:115 (+) Transcript_5254:1044-1388(+)
MVLLTSAFVQKDGESDDVEVLLPSFTQFVRNVYVECARVLYDNVDALNPDMPDRKKLDIRERLLGCFSKAVAASLRLMIPLEAIAPKGSRAMDQPGVLDTFGEESSDESSVDEE